MAPLDDFIKRVQELRRQGCGEDQIVKDVRAKYPQLCRTSEEALRKVQAIDRGIFDPNDW
jgi:L-fucose mutarotase/ribose pyranase (RbsD/FucU family)